MAIFKDQNGKEWTVKLDAPKIQDVRKELQIDLLDLESNVYARLAADEITLIGVLWVLCRKQIIEAGVTAEQFGEALVGQTIDDAITALVGAAADFLPPRKRLLLQALDQKNQQILKMAEEKVLGAVNDEQMMERIQTAMDRKMKEELEKALIQFDSATN